MSRIDIFNLVITDWAGIWVALAGSLADRARHGDRFERRLDDRRSSLSTTAGIVTANG